MKKLLNVMLVAAVIAAFVVPGFANEKCNHKEKGIQLHHHEKEGKCSMMKELNLTEKQQAEIDKIQKECLEVKKDLHAKMTKLKEEMHKLMAAEKPNKELIYKKIDGCGNLTTKMEKICVDCKLKIRALLTPEQLKKMKEIKKEYHKQEEECKHKHK